MKPIKKFLTVSLVTILLAALSLSTKADGHAVWKLTSEESNINFVSIKKGAFAEAHTFTDYSGVVDHGKASITIKADSVDTRVPIRNERVREFLFETGAYPEISITSDVSTAMEAATTGSTKMFDLPATLSLHGVEKEVTLNVSISQNSKGGIIVASTQPVIINASDYGMSAGVLKLAELVGGIPIATAVPVSFILTFKKDK